MVFIALSYLSALLREQASVSARLEELNRELEERVNERTAALAARNQELAEANAELQKVDQLKTDFVTLVSHELRVPLTTLNGGLELALQHGEQIPPEPRRALEVMAGESQRLTHLVQAILDVSKLDAGKLPLNFGPVAVVPLLQRAADVILAGSQRRIVWTVPETLPPAWADEIYLERIICNLLSNADKYSPAGAPIDLTVLLSKGCMDITVADQGPGIPAELQTKIFNPFQRLERGDRIVTEGWGLGLYFAHGLAQAQGGRLTVQSPVQDSPDGGGTAFTLTIPITGAVPEDA
jgi:signal transduction histidine kinase